MFNRKDHDINDSSIIDILDALHNENDESGNDDANELENSLLYASMHSVF